MEQNSITFSAREQDELVEIIKITKDSFYYKGEKIEDIYNVYERFNEWLKKVENGTESV
jgi:hypothetical protein